jgi:hypothetical protein
VFNAYGTQGGIPEENIEVTVDADGEDDKKDDDDDDDRRDEL